MKQIVDRDMLRSPVRSGPPVSGAPRSVGLPTDILEAAGKRLTQVALIYAAIYLLQYVVTGAVMAHHDMPHEMEMAPFGLLTAIFVGLSLVVAWLARGERLPAERIPDIGLLYMIVAALGIEIGLLWVPNSARIEDLGLSWTVVWLAIFPLIVPATPGKMFFAALAAAAIRPLLVLILVAKGHPAPEPAMTFLSFFPNIVAVGLAVLGTRIIAELGRDVTRARQMGSYNLVERLGGGGMGEVWRADHALLARPAAIKLIRPDALGSAEPAARQEMLKRFEREARATARLSSPHTVQVHDFGVTDDSTFYYVMELLNGLDADVLVERFGPVPPARAAYIMAQVCESLEEAHADGCVHRDIKPANIFLSRVGLVHDFVKVLDFGLVKAAAGANDKQTVLTQQHVATGTPAFMAPEVAMADRGIDGRTDLYSAGCVAYWLLTGSLVFDQGNAMQLMLSHASQPPVPPSQRTEQKIPAELEQLIMQCLAKEPGERPADAGEMRRRLQAMRFDEPWGREEAQRWWQAHLPESA